MRSFKEITQYEYSSHLYNQYNTNENNVEEIAPLFDTNSKLVDGRIILRNNFEKLFEKIINLFALMDWNVEILKYGSKLEKLSNFLIQKY